MNRAFYRNTCLAALSFLLILLFAVMAPKAHAAAGGADASIRVEQTFTLKDTDKAPGDTFSYVLHPADSANPMPSGTAADGDYYFSIDGTANVALGAIHFERTGIYTYQVRQVLSEQKSGYTYDSEEYSVQVVVKNAKDGGLTAEVWLPVNASGEKEETISFTNGYTKTVEPTNKTEEKNTSKTNQPKTGDEAQITLCIALAGAAFCLFLFLLCYKKRSEDEQTMTADCTQRGGNSHEE